MTLLVLLILILLRLPRALWSKYLFLTFSLVILLAERALEQAGASARFASLPV